MPSNLTQSAEQNVQVDADLKQFDYDREFWSGDSFFIFPDTFCYVNPAILILKKL